MRLDEIIIWISAVGILIGAADRIFGNKFGLGEKFEEGLFAMGPLALTMGGLICLAPVIADLIGPAVSVALKAIGCDPSLLGAFLPNDTGGYPLAMELCENETAGLYSGLIVASMFGCTLTFSLPFAMNVLNKKDIPYFTYGTLIGMICVPVASLLGGIVAGFEIRMLLINTAPIAVISVIFALGLKMFPNAMMKFSQALGKIIMLFGTAGLAAAGFEALTGVVIIPGMTDVNEAMEVVATIGVVLMGALPILALLTKILEKPMMAMGDKMGLDVDSMVGIVMTLSNNVPVIQNLKKMNSRGKIFCSAFNVCASAALGDHLGFTAGVAPTYIPAMVAGKIFGGILAIVLCVLLVRDTSALDEESAAIGAKENK